MNQRLFRKHSESQLLTGMSITELIEYTRGLEEELDHIKKQCEKLHEESKDNFRSYKVSQGWTTKSRNALTEANRRLVEAGLEPVKVYHKKTEIENEQITLDMNTIEYIEENGQCPLCSIFTHKMGRCPRCGEVY